MTTVNTLNATVAGNIRAEMGRQQLSQTELAERLDWTRSSLSELLAERTHITLSKLEQIADVLEVDPAKLLND